MTFAKAAVDSSLVRMGPLLLSIEMVNFRELNMLLVSPVLS